MPALSRFSLLHKKFKLGTTSILKGIIMKKFKYFQKNKMTIFLVIFLTLLNSFGEMGLPSLMAVIIDKGIARSDLKVVVRTSELMLIVTVLTVLVRSSAAYFSSKVAMGYAASLRNELYTKINYMTYKDMSYFEPSSLITRTTDDVSKVEQMILMALRPMVRCPLLFLGAFIMTFSIDAYLAMIFLTIIPFMAWSSFYIKTKALPYFPEIQKKMDALNMLFRRRLSGILPIRAFSKDAYEEDEFDRINTEYTELGIEADKKIDWARAIAYVPLAFGMGLLLIFCMKKINASTMTIGQMVAICSYMGQGFMALIMLINLTYMIPSSTTSYKRISEVLDHENEKLTGDYVLDEKIKSIRVSNLFFHYSGAERDVISDWNFTIKEGESLGIIGGIGSGKTTFLKILLRFLKPSSGKVLINDIDINDLDYKSYRRRLSYVNQDNYFFTKSLGENLSYADKSAGEAKLIKALTLSKALDFLSENPLEDKVIRGGSNYSGGQRQRLSIARALSRKADVYIFDDSFSALDYITDSKVRENLNKNLQGSIKIIVAQRIATIKKLDKILVLDDGKQLGFGSHDELMKTCKTYIDIAISQGEDQE